LEGGNRSCRACTQMQTLRQYCFCCYLNKYGIAVFRDSSFVRMTGRRKPQLQDLFANAAYEAILFLLLFK
ncbi:hypothetical protein, partial [Sphingobacterium sp. NPDC055346]